MYKRIVKQVSDIMFHRYDTIIEIHFMKNLNTFKFQRTFKVIEIRGKWKGAFGPLFNCSSFLENDPF